MGGQQLGLLGAACVAGPYAGKGVRGHSEAISETSRGPSPAYEEADNGQTEVSIRGGGRSTGTCRFGKAVVCVQPSVYLQMPN